MPKITTDESREKPADEALKRYLLHPLRVQTNTFFCFSKIIALLLKYTRPLLTTTF